MVLGVAPISARSKLTVIVVPEGLVMVRSKAVGPWKASTGVFTSPEARGAVV